MSVITPISTSSSAQTVGITPAESTTQGPDTVGTTPGRLTAGATQPPTAAPAAQLPHATGVSGTALNIVA
jgi:hypothetical protein